MNSKITIKASSSKLSVSVTYLGTAKRKDSSKEKAKKLINKLGFGIVYKNTELGESFKNKSFIKPF